VTKIPLIRKLVKLGNSQAITLPASWLKYLEKQTGQKIKSVAVEVDGVLKVAPIIEKEPPRDER